jgi:Flavin reductase like domain
VTIDFEEWISLTQDPAPTDIPPECHGAESHWDSVAVFPVSQESFMKADDAFHTLVSRLDYPMFIVTTAAEGLRAGCLVGYVTQSSIEPPRLIVMLSKLNHTYRVAERSQTLAVHFLSDNNQRLPRYLESPLATKSTNSTDVNG